MKFLSDILAKAGLTVDGVVTLNNTATGQTPAANDNSTKLATTAWVRTFVQPYSLPIASASVLGGIKVGSGLSIDSGTGILSVTGGGAASIKSTQTFIATAGQTVFTITGGYTPTLIDVFLNGVYLSPNQTTATNGTTVTLGEAALVGDIIDVIVASPIYEGATTTTDQLPEGVVNLYYTNARARAAISLTVTGTYGASTYNSSTGVLNVPTYTLAGLGGVVSTRTITINGVTYDLTANRTWSALPTGGTAGQLLAKVDGTDYNAQWINEAPAASYTSQIKHQVKASQAITKGQAVYVSSADGTNMIVSKASNAAEGTSSKTMGLLESTVSTNGFTNVIAEGLLAGLNTNGANAGDPVWLGTDGNLIYGLLNKPSAPAHLVFIGVVTRANANNGEIFVKVQNGFEMGELHDYVQNGVQDNYVISYESSTSLYKPKSIATLLGYTPANAARSLTINGTTYDLTADRTWTLTTSVIAEGTNLYYTDARVGTYLTNNSYATQTYVNTAVSNLVDTAPGTLDTLNELAAALGDDPNFATTVATSIGTKEPIITAGTTSQYWRGDKTWQTLPVYTLSGLGGVPTTRTLTINGTTYDLSADRSWSIAAGVTSFNTRTGAITLVSGDVTGALGYTPYNSSNPNGYISSYTETDTLASVTGRGATTSVAVSFNATVTFSATPSTGGTGDWTSISSASYKVSAPSSYWRIIYTGTDGSVSGVYNYQTGKSVYWGEDTDTGNYVFRGRTLKSGSNTVWHTGNLTNLNQLSNGPGYITGYTETDTLQSVTSRGATTSSSTIFTGGLYARKNQSDNNYTTAALWTESYGNTTTGIAFHISGVVGKFLEMRTNGVLYWENGQVWTSGTLTNLSQLSNGPGYITSSGNISGYAMSLNGYSNQTIHTILTGPANGPVWKVRYDSATANRYVDLGFQDGNGVYSEGLKIYNGGSLTWLGNTVWHAGNLTNLNQLSNGPGYITSSATSLSLTGNLTVSSGNATGGGIILADDGDIVDLNDSYCSMRFSGGVRIFSANRGGSAVITLSNSGAISAGSIAAGNITTGVNASHIVQRDSNGYIYANHVNFSTSETENPSINSFITSNGDGWSRKSTLAHVKNSIRGVADGTWGISITGSAAQLGGWSLQNVVPYHSGSDFGSGTLVVTNINASVTYGDSFVMEVTGKSYGSGPAPFGLMLEGYIYADTFINVGAISYGSWFPGPIKILNYSGNLAFWWPRGSYWNSFSVRVREAGGSASNRVTSITDSGEPSSSKKVSVSVIQSLHSSNYNSYSPTLTGGNASGTWGISITGNAGSVSGRSAGNSAGNLAYFDSNGNLYVNNPESYSGEVRLGAAWGRGGVYASNVLTMSTSSGSIDFVHGNSLTARLVGNSGAYGPTLMLGTVTPSYTLIDTNYRPVIYLHGQYPVLTLNHTVTSNTSHGPTIQFTFDGYAQRQWVIGCGGSGDFMDIGFSSSGYGNSNYNPHNGIAGYQGNTIMRIMDNMVGIGNDWGAHGNGNPGWTLDVRGTTHSSNIRLSGTMVLSGSGAEIGNSTGTRMSESYGVVWNFSNSATWHHQIVNGSSLVGFYSSGGNYGGGNIYASGDITAYYSDKRLKHNLNKIDNAISKLNQLTGYTYQHNKLGQSLLKENPYKVHSGLIAQEVQQVLPEVVTIAPFDLDGYDEFGQGISRSGENYLTIKYDRIVPLLIEGIKEQQVQIESQKTEIEELKDLVKQLINR